MSERRSKLEDRRVKKLRPFLTSHFSLLTSRRAFTIVEMVVVVSIVLILVTLVLPGMNSLWNQRKLADAENSITGMLMSARAKAMQSGAEGGLFFFVDDRNVQRVVSIMQDPTRVAQDPNKLTAQETVYARQLIFVVTSERSFDMPAPMRVVPRFVILDPSASGGKDLETYSDVELANNNVLVPATVDVVNRQRNFFSLVYSPNGDLLVRREVLILEPDDNKDLQGDITALHLADLGSLKPQYYKPNYSTDNATPSSLLPADGSASIQGGSLISDSNGVALNFPSVDGLLVYDDSLFSGAGNPATKRKYLMDSGQPFYIHRLTGAVVRGPLGKNVP